MKHYLYYIFCGIILFSCQNTSKIGPKKQLLRPNVILIMADDIGFECLSINGSISYKTPVLDSLALNGINFTKAISQPLCTPSRVKIMTGKFNYKNYDYFTYLNPKEKTFGNLFRENGYKTAIVGKWQLNGIEHQLEGYDDNTRPHHFGFDEYSLWQLTKVKKYGERFANPLIEENGKFLPRDENAYGPDIVSNYAINFIKRNKEQPFFLYYPMLLVHGPFVPTPDSQEWKCIETKSKKDNKFFTEMVSYMDKIIGKIVNELKVQGIAENTLLFFVGDNGTFTSLVSQTENGPIRGGKGNTITHGNHVPLIANWPNKIKNPRNYSGLINFTDFYATFTDILGVHNKSDGTSMMDVFANEIIEKRKTATSYYDPMWSPKVTQFRNVYSQDYRYKLYKNGEFYDMENDVLETKPLKDENLDEDQKTIKAKLTIELATFPSLPEFSFVRGQ
ncbi:MAG: arylsulfatase A [Flavobacteriaceae bacterium]|nr:arylsulfatase A [Flavobacteriaceae bacterium]|tara:strand:- start:1197 stop:2540 length:1344 start_codon:yes stop_codon:yes gene_type:complete